MKFYKYLAVGITAFIGLFQSSQAQDIHFSQFYTTPYNLSPALAGQFTGSIRMFANYRNQWSSIGYPYSTYSASVDGNYIRRKNGNRDIFGIGVNAFSDKAGDASLRTFAVGVPFSYSRDFDPRGDFIVSGGGQIGFSQKTIDFSKLSFNSQYVNFSYDPANPSGENQGASKATYMDFSIGGNIYRSYLNKNGFNVGVGIFHFNRPSYSFISYGSEQVNTRIMLYGNAQLILGKKRSVDLLPAAVFMWQRPHRQLVVGTNLRWYITNTLSNKNVLYFGAFYRALDRDAVIISTRFDWQQLNFGLSYDITTSALSSITHFRSAFEVSLVYVLFRSANEVRSRYDCATSF